MIPTEEFQRVKYTGDDSRPAPFTSVGNQLLVKFISTQFVADKGFYIDYYVYVPTTSTEPPSTTTIKVRKVKPISPEGRKLSSASHEQTIQ